MVLVVLNYVIIQERQAALAAVSSQLWQGRNRAAANSPHPPVPGRAITNSPGHQGPVIPGSFIPSADTRSAAAIHVIPTAHGAITQDITSSAVAPEGGKDKANDQQLIQIQAAGSGQKPPFVEIMSQQGLSEKQQGVSEGQQGCSEGHQGHSEGQQGRSEGQQGRSEGQQGRSERQQGVSERESRAAARLSRLARSSTTGSNRLQQGKTDLDSESNGNIGRV